MRWCEGGFERNDAIARCRYGIKRNEQGRNVPLSLIGRRRTVTWTDDDPVDAMVYCATNESGLLGIPPSPAPTISGLSGKLSSGGTEVQVESGAVLLRSTYDDVSARYNTDEKEIADNQSRRIQY